MPLFEFEGRRPEVSSAAWIAPTATLIGDVRVEAEASIWYGAVLRADFGPILVRQGANIQDCSVLHGGTDPVTEVGEGATIGHLCVIHGAVIGEEALVGNGATVLDGVIVGRRALVAAGCTVPPGMIIPDDMLAVGVPARIAGPVTGGAKQWVQTNPALYRDLARRHAASVRPVDCRGPAGLPSPGNAGPGNAAHPRGGVMDKDLAEQVAGIAHRVVASGAISANGHGNVSVRVPGAEEMYFTAGPSLRDHPASAVVRVGLDGALLEGDLPPIQGAVVAMHTAMYRDHPDVGCVVHTHSPHATAYAVAQRRIGCWIEAMAMFGLADGVPVAGYGPRGSAEAVANIRGAVIPGVPAVLLANHGVLIFHRTPDLAILAGSVVEEAAQAGLNSQPLGGPVEIPPDLRAAALQRAMAFDSRGTVHA